MGIKQITVEEAASMVKNGDFVGFSGFTHVGCPKAVPKALAERAEEEHRKGNEFLLDIISGASTGDYIDGALSRAKAIKSRTPYQSNKDSRLAINNNEYTFFDVHLSSLSQRINSGFYRPIDIAIIEAADVTDNGEIILTCAVGITPTIVAQAKKIIVELNSWHPQALRGIHDLPEISKPPLGQIIPILKPQDRIGKEFISADPDKIFIVNTHIPNEGEQLNEINDTTTQIGLHVTDFILNEMSVGRIPKSLLPFQLGVGNTANAAIYALGENKEIPQLTFYTEVMQDAVINLILDEKINFASTVAIPVTQECVKKIYDNLSFFKEKVVLRPPEITNSPEVIRRLGLITMNTAIEADIMGNVNSSHMMGQDIMNGIGGSGDFTRNAYTSIFLTPSVTKGGTISKIVPMVTHVDHSEHSVDVIITEYGIADLRGRSPRERANIIINNCAHPDYRPLLREYLKICNKGHAPFSIYHAFAFHKALTETGDMRNVRF